ncbi:BtrH N-terminal domain-containing protein [Haloarchaeobius sp. HRN-SO-5]|uniref:BtrH N-terminal domain-containing protein n=1 Tax=Haloarchaeobius sp. HRN-SO-5 TaxID=3446118 RepID=UPI003EBAD22C
MELVEGYDHQPGVHCGASALRNVTEYYGWRYTEAACFGIGGGATFVLYEHPDHPWVTFRTTPLWLERAFFENLGIPHTFREGDDFETAWENVTAHVDDDDPVILFLDPTRLEYLPEEPDHLPPHVAVVIGYDDETVLLSDGALDGRHEVSRSVLRDAWTEDRFASLENEYLVVTRAARTVKGNDAAAAGLRQGATYMLDPLEIKRDPRGPGEEGIPALRSFADYVGRWPDLPEPARPVRAARRAINEHGEGAAFRDLYADALEELGQRTDLAPDIDGRMADVAREWRIVEDRLGDVLEADDPGPGLFEEASTVVADIADQEEALFEAIADELGRVRTD